MVNGLGGAFYVFRNSDNGRSATVTFRSVTFQNNTANGCGVGMIKRDDRWYNSNGNGNIVYGRFTLTLQRPTFIGEGAKQGGFNPWSGRGSCSMRVLRIATAAA